MACINPKLTYVLEVNATELNLISKALRDNLQTQDEFEMALSLQRDLMIQKCAHIEHLARENDKLKKNLEVGNAPSSDGARNR